jgi:hypothetical protein
MRNLCTLGSSAHLPGRSIIFTFFWICCDHEAHHHQILHTTQPRLCSRCVQNLLHLPSLGMPRPYLALFCAEHEHSSSKVHCLLAFSVMFCNTPNDAVGGVNTDCAGRNCLPAVMRSTSGYLVLVLRCLILQLQCSFACELLLHATCRDECLLPDGLASPAFPGEDLQLS